KEAAPAVAAPDKKPADTSPSTTTPAATAKKSEKGADNGATKEEKKHFEVKIDFTALDSRLDVVPVPPGNYGSLQATDRRLCWLSASGGAEPRQVLQCLDIANKGDGPDTVLAGVEGFEI